MARDLVEPRLGPFQLSRKAEQKFASSPKGALNITPIGRPASLQCSGTVMLGWPVMLKSCVNGMNSTSACPDGRQ